MADRPVTRYDINKLPHLIAVGGSTRDIDIADVNIPPGFVRMVVLDVISDPTEIDEKLLTHWVSDVKVKNIEFISSAPRNSIIAGYVRDGMSAGMSPPMLLYPFFPSHLSLPVKPGEHVWVMFERPGAREIKIGFWFCKITVPHIADDVNHTHSPRQFDGSYFPSKKTVLAGTFDPKFELRNGKVFDNGSERYTEASTAFISGTEDQYEKLAMGREGWGLASKLIDHESVPRYKKRPADLVLEGSNNSLIVLGTDRTSAAATYSDSNYGRQGSIPTSDVRGKSGMIDLVTGRGQVPATAGEEAQTKTISGADMWKELNKTKFIPGEGNPDLKSDRSRVAIYQKSKIDTNYGLSTYNTKNFSDAPGSPDSGLKDGTGAGGIVIKSDKVRVIARADVEIVVTGYTKDADGNFLSKEADDDWASIVIRSNGDIIFKPANKGVIKLGGDDADLAVLCNTGTNTMGTVTGVPINDTAGGQQGQGGIFGTFAKKVLFK